MLRSILIVLDGSPYSASAVELGIQWARRFDALFVGLGVVDEPIIRKPVPMPIGGSYYKLRRDDTLVARARCRVEQFLERFALRCAEVGVPCKLLEDVGYPERQIQIEAQRYDLILLGQQTYFHFETQESDCNTLHAVLKNSPRPVVAVPERLGDGRSVVIAYDGSLPAGRVLQVFQALGLYDSQEVHVVSVAPDKLQAARHGDRAVEFLGLHEINARPHAIGSSERPAQVILHQVRELDACLLVMGAYGHSTLRDYFLGSITRTLLNQSPVPLFLYH